MTRRQIHLVRLVVTLAASVLVGATEVSAQQGPINLPEPTITRLVLTKVDSAFSADLALKNAANRLAARNGTATKADTLRVRNFLDRSDYPIATQCLIDYLNAQEKRRVGDLEDPLLSYGCVWLRYRTRTVAGAREFFGGVEAGNAIALSFGQDQAALYTEILSDNLWINDRLGYARIGLSGQVSAASDSASRTTAVQFFQGGGNAVLYVALPVHAWLNYFGAAEDPTSLPKLIRRNTIHLTFATGADVPEMNTAASELAANFRLGANIQGFWGANADLFRFFWHGNGHVVSGSEKFYQNLLGTDTERGFSKPFLSGTVTIGTDLAKLVRLGVRFGGVWLLEGVSQTPQFTIQFLPQTAVRD
jgi:hypothetical protein